MKDREQRRLDRLMARHLATSSDEVRKAKQVGREHDARGEKIPGTVSYEEFCRIFQEAGS